MKFKVGQKVRMVEDECDARVGDIGIIAAVVPHVDKEYAVEFPCFKERNCGHNCDGLVPSGNGHWIDESEIELAQDFPEITQVTIKDSSGTTTVRAKVTKDPNGYTIEEFGESKFSEGEQFVTASGKLGIVTKVNPGGNYCVQWFNGKYCSAQPEDTMCKIVWDK